MISRVSLLKKSSFLLQCSCYQLIVCNFGNDIERIKEANKAFAKVVSISKLGFMSALMVLQQNPISKR